jgi:hypothetical protein
MLLTCKVEAYGMPSVPDMRKNHRKTVPEWFPAERDRTDRQADRQTDRQTNPIPREGSIFVIHN